MRRLLIPVTLAFAPFATSCDARPAQPDAAVDAPSDARPDAMEAAAPVCQGRRDGGGVSCLEENLRGSGLFCIQRSCAADDGGTDLNDCCRLVG